MPQKIEANRYIQLTDSGRKRMEETRRKYHKTIEDIVGDRNTPSVNTVKKAMKQGAVFQDTLERIWDYLQRCAAEKNEMLPDLVSGEDYVFVEGAAKTEEKTPEAVVASPLPESRWGWVSRQTPHPNRLFTGRRDVLHRLHSALKAGSAALVPDPQALTGLGGIGKTQTAIAYIYEYRSAYNGVYWVSAETVESLDEGLAGLAEELKLLSPASATKQAALQKMHEWFQNESDWLLVLDNADDLETLALHFPRHHAGSLLLTTRARNTVRWAAPVEIVKFARQEGALLLLRRAGVLDISQSLEDAPLPVGRAAMELSDELDGLPLALDQAGAYLAETQMTVPDYLAQFRKYGLALLDDHADRDQRSVSVTFRLALEQMAQRRRRGQAAIELVRLCAFLDPDAIPEAIFASYSFPQPASSTPLAPADYYVQVSAAACSYSLLRRSAQNKTLSIHRLVQKVIRESLSVAERRDWAERAVCAVSEATPDFEFEDWPLCDLLLPQWRLCAETIQTESIVTEKAAYLLYQAGRYLRARALYAEAETFLLRAVEIGEKVHGTQHPTLAEYLDALGCFYRELDRCEEAKPLHERAIQIIEAWGGPEHLEMAGKLHNLALLHVMQQEYVRAEECFLRVLAIRDKHPNQEQLTAAALTQLAGVYRYQGSNEKAEPYSRRALTIYENTLEPNHISIATAQNNLALLCINLNQFAEAETLCRKALKINEEQRGREHPETGTVMWTLAITCWKQSKSEEADRLFQRAIHVYTQHYGEGHARLVRLKNYYAEFQEASGSKP